MADKDDALTITDPSHVAVTFVNQLVGSGFLNGVVNLTFAVANFTPAPDNTVSPDLVIASRLRMDLFCATQLRDVLSDLIAQNTK